MHSLCIESLLESSVRADTPAASCAHSSRATRACELAFATANERRGERARLGGADVRFIAHDDAPLTSAELVFSALPHGASATWVERVRRLGRRAVDLSSDLRPGQRGGPRSRTDSPSLRALNCVMPASSRIRAAIRRRSSWRLLPLAKRGLIRARQHRERDGGEWRDRSGATRRGPICCSAR